MSRSLQLRRLLDSERGYLAAAPNSDMASVYEREISDLEDSILRFERYRVIAELCVVKNLPAGFPCWMAKKIGELVESLVPSEEEDKSFLPCGCCRHYL